ncbi:MAG: ATP-binding protein [Bacteroidales bacterium]
MRLILIGYIILILMSFTSFASLQSDASSLSDEFPRKLITDGKAWINSSKESKDKNPGLGYLAIARGYSLIGNEDSAIQAIQKALAVFTETGDKNSVLEAKLLWADILIPMGKLQQSAELFIAVINQGKDQEDLATMALGYNGLGLVFRNFSEYLKARQYLQISLELSLKSNNERSLAAVYKNLGTYYYYLKKYDVAYNYYLKALTYWNDKGIHEEKCGLINNVANALRDQGKTREAIEKYNQALQMARSIGSVYLHTVILKNLGVVAFENHSYQEAFALFKRASGDAKKYKLKRIEKDVLKQEALINAEIGNYKLSIEKFLGYEKLQDSLLKENQYQDIVQSINEMEQERDKNELSEQQRIHQVEKLTTTRNYLFILVILLLLSIVLIIVVYNYLSKLKINKALEQQRDEVIIQKDELQEQYISLQQHNEVSETLVKERTFELQRINDLLREEIEERKKAVLKLHDHQEYLMELLNSVADPVFVKDHNHKWVMLNDAAVKIFGLTREELLGKSDFDVFPEEEAKVFWTKDDEVLNTGKININEELITTYKGDTYIIETKKKLYNSKKGEKFIVGIITDITEQRTLQKQILELNQSLENKILERTHQLQMLISSLEAEIEKRKQIEKELFLQMEKAEESSRLKTNFLSNMSHEIRTPLTGILGYAELLHEDNEKENESHTDMTQKIIISGKRLLSTLDSVLLLSHLQSDQVKPIINNADVSSVIKTVIPKFRDKSTEKNIPVTFQYHETIEIKTDKALLAEVIAQVVDNALKFSNEGEIIISAVKEQAGERLGCIISVSDNGIGINDNQKEYIFDDFRQGSEGWGRSFEGNGLGLSIAKRIVLLLHGNIWAENNEIQGSVFKIWLPLS